MFDRSGAVWRGSFPGLGSVEVDPDGTVTVHPDDGPAGGRTERTRALLHAWGEPLSLARRGVDLIAGAGIVHPMGAAAIVLHGAPHEVAMVMIALSARGWSVLADRLVPIEFGPEAVIALPRSAPVLLPRRRAVRAGLDVEQARRDSDSVIVHVERAEDPTPVHAVIDLAIRRPHEPTLTPLDGHRRFETASSLLVTGVLADDDSSERSPGEQMRRHLRLAALPIARYCIDDATLDEDVDALVEWWDRASATAGEAT